jgi:hypothetical protein
MVADIELMFFDVLTKVGLPPLQQMSATHHKPAPEHNNQQPKQSFVMANKWRA